MRFSSWCLFRPKIIEYLSKRGFKRNLRFPASIPPQAIAAGHHAPLLVRPESGLIGFDGRLHSGQLAKPVQDRPYRYFPPGTDIIGQASLALAQQRGIG